MDNKKFYITTPIYYPSGKFHIGTAYATTLTDCLSRYKKLQGYDTYFLTGLDEHGQKVQTVAEKNGLSPQEHVDKMADAAKKLWKEMDISYNDFIRTTEERHEKAVNKIVEKFLANGDIYKGKYEAIEKIRVVAWNKLIKRNILEETKIQFPKGYRYEDVEFTYKLITYLDKISFLKKPCIHYIQREKSISNTQNERTKEIFDVFENVFKFYKEKNIFEQYHKELEYTYARVLLCSSLKRMCKVNDKKIKKQLLNQTWDNLNSKFPNWKSNGILKDDKSLKSLYMKSINKVTYKIYTMLFSI